MRNQRRLLVVCVALAVLAAGLLAVVAAASAGGPSPATPRAIYREPGEEDAFCSWLDRVDCCSSDYALYRFRRQLMRCDQHGYWRLVSTYGFLSHSPSAAGEEVGVGRGILSPWARGPGFAEGVGPINLLPRLGVAACRRLRCGWSRVRDGP